MINLNIVLLGVVVFFGVCGWKYFSLKGYYETEKNPNIIPGQLYKVDYLDNAEVLGESFESQPIAQVRGEENADVSQESSSYASEDFKIDQISITGNPNVDLEIGDESSPLALSGIKNEILSSKGDEIKAVVSWKTNRLSISEIGYFKNGDNIVQEAREDEFGMNHNMMLASLDADSVYNFTINSKDRDGNAINSEKFAFYTGAPNISFMDVLEESSEKLFGWAIKK